MNPGVTRIIWTVDPFAKEKDLQRAAAWAIKNLCQGSDSSIIEPVYFFSAYLTGEYPAGVPQEWVRDVRKRGQTALNQIVRRIDLKTIRPLHVISIPYLSIRDGVERINLIAQRWKADVIVTSTHARKGIKRLFLGSFAETLLLRSNLPLLFVNPHWNQRRKFKHILFPTDFSDESKEAFFKVLDIAHSLHVNVTLFHKLAYMWPPTVIIPTGTFPLYSQVSECELDTRERDIQKWTAEAKAKGVQVEGHIDNHIIESSIVESILAEAKKAPGIIALASRSGPVKTSLLGSTTRKLVRESPYPVWVLHPKAHVQEKEESPFRITEEDIEKDLQHIPHGKKAA